MMPTKWTQIEASINNSQDITSLKSFAIYDHDGSDIDVRIKISLIGLADSNKVLKLHLFLNVESPEISYLLKPIGRIRYEAGELSYYDAVELVTETINLKGYIGLVGYKILSTDSADNSVNLIAVMEQVNGSTTGVSSLISNLSGVKEQVDKLQFKAAPTLPVTPAHHYIATEGITESGGVISQWDDVGEDGTAHLTQASVGNRPTLTTIDGVTSVKFTKLNEEFFDMPSGVSINPQDFTVMVIYKPTSGDAVGSTSSSLRRRGGLVTFGNSEVSAHLSNEGVIAAKTDGVTEVASEMSTSLGYGVLIARGTASELTLNYGAETETVDAHDNNTPITGGWVGRLVNATGGSDNGAYFDGHVVEIVIFNSALSDENIALLQDYGTDKYNALSRTETFSLVVAGDSLSDGTGAVSVGAKNGDLDWVSMLARTCGNQPKVFHRAVGGWSVTDEIKNDRFNIKSLITQNSEYSTRVAMLWGGINDIANDEKTAAEVTIGEGGIAEWITDIKSAGSDVKVVLATITPSLSLSESEELIRLEVNEWIRNESEADLVVELANHRNLVDPNNSTYYSDNTHFTAEGYKVIAHTVHSAFLNKGWVIDDIKPAVGAVMATLNGEYVQLSEQFLQGIRYAMLNYSRLAEKQKLDDLYDEHYYQIQVSQVKDDAAETPVDEWTVAFFKNTQPITSGITSVTLTVTKRSDGLNLINAAAMTQIGSTGVFKLDETENRVSTGEGYINTVTALIDGVVHTLRDIRGRDS
jgi:lysophospholipase L1-like esterase